MFFYQQYYFQRLAKITLNSLNANNTPVVEHTCLTQDYIVNFIKNASFIALQKRVNNLNMLSNIVSIGSSFCSSVFLGPLSDKFGRKPILLAASIGLGLSTAMQALVVYFDLNVYYFLLLLAVHGFTGGFPLACGTSFAAVTDSTPRRWLGLRMSILEAAIAFGRAAASLGTNNWIHLTNCDFLYPSLLNMGIAFLVVVFTLLMSESIPAKRSVKQTFSNQGMGKIFTGIKIYFNPSYLGFSNWWRAWAATCVICLGCVCAIGGAEILNFFLHNRPLEWSYEEIGYFGACMSVLMGLVLICIVPLLITAKLPNPVIGLIGVFCGVSGNVIVALAKLNWEMYIGKNVCIVC